MWEECCADIGISRSTKDGCNYFWLWTGRVDTERLAVYLETQLFVILQSAFRQPGRLPYTNQDLVTIYFKSTQNSLYPTSFTTLAFISATLHGLSPGPSLSLVITTSSVASQVVSFTSCPSTSLRKCTRTLANTGTRSGCVSVPDGKMGTMPLATMS